MERVEIISKSLHGDKEQKIRTEILDEFRSGMLKVLIATDVSARGIDIPDVDYVVNYDLPDIAETYVHRVGRTGRGVKRGRAVSFCSNEEKNLLDAIEKWMDKKIKVFEISSNDYEMTLDFSDAAAFGIKDALKEIELSGVNFKQQKKKSKK